jgi:hypothetical protein
MGFTPLDVSCAFHIHRLGMRQPEKHAAYTKMMRVISGKAINMRDIWLCICCYFDMMIFWDQNFRKV